MEFGTNKTLTIAIPTYNRGKFLKTALENLSQNVISLAKYRNNYSDNVSTYNTQKVLLSVQNLRHN